ncbi:MAG: glycosyltransferase [Sphingomicrobium sp.]
MRVAFLLPTLSGGGAERVALTLIDQLLGNGVEVDLVVAQAVGELLPLVPSSATFFDLQSPRLRDALWPFARYLRQRRPDAVQISMWPLTSVAIAAKWLSRTRPRMVVSEHVAISRDTTDLSPVSLALARRSLGATYRHADGRVAVSRGVATDLAAFGRLPLASIDVIYNPIAIPAKIETSAEAEGLWGSGLGPRILNVGGFRRQKNQRLLLEAFARLKARDARLIVLGEGPLRDEIVGDIARLGLGGRVAMPGFTRDPWPFYKSADLFVLSSDYEGFGNVIVEALAADLPVVSTDCPSGPAEILGGGKYGALTPCGDVEALAAAIDHALTQPPPAGMAQRAAEFSPDRAARAYRDLLFGRTNNRDEPVANLQSS